MNNKFKYTLSKPIVLKAAHLNTPLGPMLVIADEEKLCLLDFVDSKNLERKTQHLQQKAKTEIIFGKTSPTHSITNELEAYFSRELKSFKTPFSFYGSTFQQQVWDKLVEIHYAQRISYLDLAKSVGNPTGFRAVAQANSANQLAIIVPCHRVIHANGNLGGYAGGIERKRWLINHES